MMNRLPTPTSRPGFTLTEILVATALMLLILIGINQVFTMTSKTISVGTASADVNRALKGVGSSFNADLAGPEGAPTGVSYGIMPSVDQPAIIISNQKSPATPLDANDTTSAVHRIDQLSLFSQGVFKRRTGQNHGGISQFVVDQNPSTYAWIWYGHAKIPNNNSTPTWYDPGEADVSGSDKNDNHNYVVDWTLARQAICLISRSAVLTDAVVDESGRPLLFVSDKLIVPLAPFAVSSPIASHSASGGNDAAYGSDVIQDSLIDIATAELSNGSPKPATDYWDVVANSQGIPQSNPNWYSPLLYRFKADPFTTRTPSARSMAQAAPVLLRGCSDFIVEFAGDFSPNDGTIDFIPASSGSPRRIQWYGLPRTDDPDVIAAPVGTYQKLNTATQYLCAWGPAELTTTPNPPRPYLLRITVRAVDPTGRLNDPISQEYIFRVP